jgi:hypothetical protein
MQQHGLSVEDLPDDVIGNANRKLTHTAMLAPAKPKLPWIELLVRSTSFRGPTSPPSTPNVARAVGTGSKF